MHGNNLDSVARPQVLFVITAKRFKRRIQAGRTDLITDCDVFNSTTMMCMYPEFPATGEIMLKFLMDGTPEEHLKLPVTVQANPVFFNFTEIKEYNKDNIVINVSH